MHNTLGISVAMYSGVEKVSAHSTIWCGRKLLFFRRRWDGRREWLKMNKKANLKGRNG
jgi:hypothetical protein